MPPSLADRRFGGFLFDMDGTLLTSIAASQRVWGRWAARFGLDAASFLPQSHGMQVREVIERLGLPGVDVDREAEAILAAELADMDGVRAIAGASAFLAGLPADRWAVVTSAPPALARRRLAAAALPIPPLLVTADDVPRGKPDPSCFLLAAQRLGVAPARCVVFEDAPAGITAAERAGAVVIAVTAAHAGRPPTHVHAIADFTGLSIRPASDAEWMLVPPEAGDLP